MAGNQLGKTLAGAAEVAMHLTGRYPDWWDGTVFDRPVKWMAGSESSELTRKGVQRLLLGPPEDRNEWGTGYIPANTLVDTSPRPGVPDAVSSIVVKHVSGGNSIIALNSYDQGRSKWQADTVDGVWFDEEPPQDVYLEGLTRTNRTAGPIMLTFTPLLGLSDVVMRYLQPGPDDPGRNDRMIINMTIEDAEHYSPEERARIIASYPAHEREARTKGIPSLGSGRIFPVSEEMIAIAPLRHEPRHWARIIGVDFGWDHPFGAVNCLWDRDGDVLYVTHVYRVSEQTPIIHAAAIRQWNGGADWTPIAWPHDGLQHDKGSGEQLAEQYRKQRLNMLPERATFADGTNGVEAGVSEMLQRMQTGRLKVYNTCTEWFEEFRLYHRKDGRIVKQRDDVLSATRYAMMMLRFAATEPYDDVDDVHDRRRTVNANTGY